jgi:DNA-binding GntR family transcriptional regulator
LSQPDKRANRKQLRIARRLNTVGQIHDELRKMILGGSFEPGTRLSQIRLAKQLRVGRTPLREALRMLQQEGLIVAEHNKRPRLLSFDPEVIDASSAEVILLFSLATTVSVPQLKDENITAIRNSLEDMRQATQKEDLEAWVQADINFHAGAFVHVGVPLEQRLRRVNDENQFYLRFLVSRENVPWSKVEEDHQAILDACIARNGDLASKLVARHVAGGAITILAHAMPEREPRMIRAAMRLIVQQPQPPATRERAEKSNDDVPRMGKRHAPMDQL